MRAGENTCTTKTSQLLKVSVAVGTARWCRRFRLHAAVVFLQTPHSGCLTARHMLRTSETGHWRSVPDERRTVALEDGIATYERKAFSERLGHEHPIEWISVP